MALYAALLCVLCLIWAAFGFTGIGIRIQVIAQVAFSALLLLAVSTFAVAQAFGT